MVSLVPVRGLRCSQVLALGAVVAVTNGARADDEGEPASRVSPVLAAGVWTMAQLVPSPLLVVGSGHVGGGARWQVTPLVYSFGVAAHPVRAFVVDPVARHSGAVELYGSPERTCCAPNGGSSWIARVGARVYLPIVGRGESLSWSVGGSYYRATGGDGAAVEVGAYVLYGVFGVTVTAAPNLDRREIIGALAIRYF